MHVDMPTLVVPLSDVDLSVFGLIRELTNINVHGAILVIDEVLEETDVHGGTSASNASLVNLDFIVSTGIAGESLSDINLAIVGLTDESACVNVSVAVVVVEPEEIYQHFATNNNYKYLS